MEHSVQPAVGSTYIPQWKATGVVAAVVLDVRGDMEVIPPGVDNKPSRYQFQTKLVSRYSVQTSSQNEWGSLEKDEQELNNCSLLDEAKK